MDAPDRWSIESNLFLEFKKNETYIIVPNNLFVYLLNLEILLDKFIYRKFLVRRMDHQLYHPNHLQHSFDRLIFYRHSDWDFLAPWLDKCITEVSKIRNIQNLDCYSAAHVKIQNAPHLVSHQMKTFNVNVKILRPVHTLIHCYCFSPFSFFIIHLSISIIFSIKFLLNQIFNNFINLFSIF